MKNITRIFSVVVVLVMAFSLVVCANGSMTFTISTDVDSVSSGENVWVTVDLTGPFADTAMIQYKILYDSTKFSVDTSKGKVGKKSNSYLCYDPDWNTEMKNEEGLGYIAYPACDINPTGTLNVLIVNTGGNYIDEDSDLYEGTQTATAGIIKFTALTDVDSIDSTCFSLSACKVEESDKTPFSVSVNQLAAAPEPSEDGEVTVGSAASFATDDGTAAGSKAILGATGGEYGSAFRITFTRPEGATDNGVIFGIDLDGTKKYAPKQANLLEGIGANSAITVDVSFLNGSTASGKVGFIEPQNVTGISVILSDGAGKFFYSDSTDKANKASAE